MKKIILTILMTMVITYSSTAGVIVRHSHHHGGGHVSNKTALALLIVVNFISLTIILTRAMMWTWKNYSNSWKKITSRGYYQKDYSNSPFAYVFGDFSDIVNGSVTPLINTIFIGIIDIVAIIILLTTLVETLI